LQTIPKSLAVQQLHYEKGLALLVFADIIDGTDMRMIDARCSSCFSPESFQRRWIGWQDFRQELDCHFASEADVFRAVDHAHASTAQMRNNSVVRNGTADHRFAGSIAQAVAG
jgi:hypothetical protein